ncbi:hypothetical protein [Bacillus sp. JCM 19041]|uniref:hypothetical protein n=1 Tax=Bacillus sp. JCM 19041 TaxID=1460637 RepID=UPI0006CF4298
MNTFKGPFRIVFEDLRIQLFIIGGITIVLSIVYFLLGVFASADEVFNAGASFGPIYGLLLFYPFFFFNRPYQFTLAFGGTRKQFLLAVFSAGAILIVAGGLLLNSLYFLNQFLVDHGYSMGTIFHMADLGESTNPLLYIWIDLLWCTFLFGIGTAMSSLWFYLGTLRTMIVATIVGIGLISYVTFGSLGSFFEFIVMNYLSFVHITGLLGLLGLLFTYLLMRNGPLERGGEGGFFGKQPKAE